MLMPIWKESVLAAGELLLRLKHLVDKYSDVRANDGTGAINQLIYYILVDQVGRNSDAHADLADEMYPGGMRVSEPSAVYLGGPLAKEWFDRHYSWAKRLDWVFQQIRRDVDGFVDGFYTLRNGTVSDGPGYPQVAGVKTGLECIEFAFQKASTVKREIKTINDVIAVIELWHDRQSAKRLTGKRVAQIGDYQLFWIDDEAAMLAEGMYMGNCLKDPEHNVFVDGQQLYHGKQVRTFSLRTDAGLPVLNFCVKQNNAAQLGDTPVGRFNRRNLTGPEQQLLRLGRDWVELNAETVGLGSASSAQQAVTDLLMPYLKGSGLHTAAGTVHPISYGLCDRATAACSEYGLQLNTLVGLDVDGKIVFGGQPLYYAVLDVDLVTAVIRVYGDSVQCMALTDGFASRATTARLSLVEMFVTDALGTSGGDVLINDTTLTRFTILQKHQKDVTALRFSATTLDSSSVECSQRVVFTNGCMVKESDLIGCNLWLRNATLQSVLLDGCAVAPMRNTDRLLDVEFKNCTIAHLVGQYNHFSFESLIDPANHNLYGDPEAGYPIPIKNLDLILEDGRIVNRTVQQ